MSVLDTVEALRRAPGLRQLLERRYERYFSSAVECHLFRGVFPSFAAAEGSLPRARRDGYDNASSAALYTGELGELRHTDYPVLFWLQKLLPGVRRVFDFGGHVGVKYYAFERYLGGFDALEWRVCDLPQVIQAGRELARERGKSQLSFTSDPSELGGQDLLLCSGSLQYVEESLAQLLERVSRPPLHVLVNSTPFTELEEFFTVNNIGTGFCVYKLQSRAAFQRSVERLGYQVVDTWENHGKSCVIPFHPEHSVSYYQGFYFRRAG